MLRKYQKDGIRRFVGSRPGAMNSSAQSWQVKSARVLARRFHQKVNFQLFSVP